MSELRHVAEIERFFQAFTSAMSWIAGGCSMRLHWFTQLLQKLPRKTAGCMMSKCRLLVTIPLMIAFQTPKSKAILLTATICWLEATIMALLLSVVEIKTQSKITVI
jgi:hypothetical protein